MKTGYDPVLLVSWKKPDPTSQPPSGGSTGQPPSGDSTTSGASTKTGQDWGPPDPQERIFLDRGPIYGQAQTVLDRGVKYPLSAGSSTSLDSLRIQLMLLLIKYKTINGP